MQVIFRAGTIVGAVGVVAAMSGYENAMYGLAGMTARMMAFVALTAVCVVADNLLEKRKRARRAGTRKAQKTNKHELICH